MPRPYGFFSAYKEFESILLKKLFSMLDRSSSYIYTLNCMFMHWGVDLNLVRDFYFD